MIPVQFITQSYGPWDHEQAALQALEGGCQWIQLRMKDCDDSEVEPIARRLLNACRDHNATFIIDDRVELCQRIEADGVHLGRHDMPVNEARAILGQGFIIGATANTIDDIRTLCQTDADYIGLGPFRYTTTKANLSPIIGLDGYRRIMQTMQGEGLTMPICAIGGITADDVIPLMQTGVHAIAVSGSVVKAERPAQAMHALIHSM